MATSYKVLGQQYPSAATATTLYTVPSATNTVVSTISVANQSGTADAIRIAIRPAGATLASSQYIAYNLQVGGFGMSTITAGITLAATDVVTIYSGTANLSFSLFGSEIS